jgi:uncharacterized RDD family membrane protein YckC
MYCNLCGAQRDDEDRFCANCGGALGAVPQLAPAVAGPQLASIGHRIVAAILDVLAWWLVFALVVKKIPRSVLRAGFDRHWPEVLIPAGLCLGGLFYYILFEAVFGMTPGKAIAGIQVRLCDWSACGFGAAFTRNLWRPADAIGGGVVGLLAAIVSKSRQRIGDMFAGTIVVLHPEPKMIRAVVIAAWIAVTGSTFVAMSVWR